jgi:hypothetical protein
MSTKTSFLYLSSLILKVLNIDLFKDEQQLPPVAKIPHHNLISLLALITNRPTHTPHQSLKMVLSIEGHFTLSHNSLQDISGKLAPIP